MEQVPLATVIPGELLGADVQDEQGNVLLSMGSVLEERHIAMLKRRGIANVVVADKAGADSDADLSEAAAARVSEVERLFAGTEEDELLSGLREIALKYARVEGGP